MYDVRCWHLAIPLLIVSCGAAANSSAHGSSTSNDTPAATAQRHSDASYPQIVRISHVEGDVRISRGKEGKKVDGSEWETAVDNLPVETGFSLATGAGRAEIEFEDTSTVYLAENSVLTFNDLRTVGGVPRTEVGLLTGTATLHVHPDVTGESFLLDTPTNVIHLKYPYSNYLRVSSYLDGSTATVLKDSEIHFSGKAEEQSVRGQTVTFDARGKIASSEPDQDESYAAWDSWVSNRIAMRSVAMAAVMKDAGLHSPLPGLADLNGQGRFFSCAPYGTCWEPSGAAADSQPESGLQDAAQTGAAPQTPAQTAQSPQVAGQKRLRTLQGYAYFPCSPMEIRNWARRDPVTSLMIYSRPDLTAAPYDWAVCHAGSWIYRNHRYAWVAGSRKHHRCPVRWVKIGGKFAYVPLHPDDVVNKPPINRVHGVFLISDKKDQAVERVALEPDSKIKLLDTAPKEYRAVSFPSLARAADPTVDAHWIGDRAATQKGSDIRKTGEHLTFDHKSQGFVLAGGSRNTSELAAFNGHIGSMQGRSGGSGGFHSAGSGGGGRASSGSSGGGGFHGGGVSSGGGGGGVSSAHH